LIHSLRLKGWKSHENSALRFGKGSNLLVGPMGAGKTSALDAICFALFGTFPALKSRKIRLEEVVMSRPQKKQSAEVEMAFDAGGKTYDVTRTISAKGGAEAVLKSDGKIIDSQSQRVTEAIEKLLGINYELFTRAIYSEQNKIDYFTTLGKGERKEQVDELLGIDRFEAARSNAGSALNKVKEAKENATSFLKGVDFENAEKEAARTAEEATAVRKKLAEGEATLAGLEREQKTKEDASKKLEEEEKKFRAAEKSLAAIKYALEEKEKEAAAKRKTIKTSFDKARIAATEEEIKREIASLRQLQKEIGDLRVKKKEADTKIQFIEAEKRKAGGADAKKTAEKVSALEQAAARHKEELKKLRDEASEAAAQVKECENALAVLAKEAAECPVCSAPLSKDKHSELKKQKTEALEMHKRKNAEISSKIKSAEQEIEKTTAEIQKEKILLGQLQRLEGLENDGKKARADLGDATVKLAGAEKQFSEEKMRAEEDKLLEIARFSELVAAEDKIAELRDGAQKAEKELKGIVFDEKMLEQARKEITGIEKEISKGQAERIALRQRAEEKEKALAELNKKLEAVEKKRGEIRALDEKTRLLTIFQNALVDAQASLRSELIDAVNGAMAALWPSVYPYNDYRDIRLRADHEGYALELKALDGAWVGIENASGGEKSCASLALRVAFSMVLAPNLSWLVLDEPTHNLDREAVVMLCNALREEIPKIVEQTFIITHDEALKEGASARIYRVERDKDKGEKSIVEELG